MPYLQHFYNDAALSLIVRTANDPTSLAATIRRNAHELTPGVPVQFTTMEALVAEHLVAPRFRALLVGLFAAVALSLATIAIFAVTAYVVGQRTTEIGLRVALGASSSAVLWLLLRRRVILTIVGVLCGFIGALALTRSLGSVLFDVQSVDPITYVGVALLLCVISVVASYVPARRATRIDPLVALRCD
jgi:putative ABC transport system permease protein